MDDVDQQMLNASQIGRVGVDLFKTHLADLPQRAEAVLHVVRSAAVDPQHAGLIVLGVLLVLSAPRLAKMRALYILCAMLVTAIAGVGILAFVLLRLVTTGRREAVLIATIVGGGAHVAATHAFWRLTETYPSACAAYIGICAIAGYALVARSIPSHAPSMRRNGEDRGDADDADHFATESKAAIPPWLDASAMSLLILAGALTLLRGLHGDVQATCTVFASTLSLRLLPRLWGLLPEARAAHAPTTYGIQRARWRPPTASGRFLSSEQYEIQRDSTTARELERLFASIGFRRHMQRQHSHMLAKRM
jgi:hypothetical protein